MKRNMPVPHEEVTVDPAQVIISTTDRNGIITHVNDYFVEISGFAAHELIGRNHNVVRHPDMPPEAFADLWQNIQAGRPWMGIVKNRCKNGDHYWVDAYVTPLLEGDEIVGYESVRTAARAEDVARAARLYRRLADGRAGARRRPTPGLRGRMTLAGAAILGLLGVCNVLFGGLSIPAAVLGSAAGTLLIFAAAHGLTAKLRRTARESLGIVDNRLIRSVYGSGHDEAAQLRTTLAMLRSRLSTVLDRVENAASRVDRYAVSSQASLSDGRSALDSQLAEIAQLATAMNEMVASVQDIARSTELAAGESREAVAAIAQGRACVDRLVEGSGQLAGRVGAAVDAIEQLSADSADVGSVVDVIHAIAEQTNLLALNAAIEAARAGEQGRGFAVVADEVRTLANRTQQSTQQITGMMERIRGGIQQVVAAMQEGQARVRDNAEEVSHVSDAFVTVTEAVRRIGDMNTQVASAAEEQSLVAEEINRNVTQIHEIAQSTSQTAEAALQANHQTAQESQLMHSLLRRFSA